MLFRSDLVTTLELSIDRYIPPLYRFMNAAALQRVACVLCCVCVVLSCVLVVDVLCSPVSCAVLCAVLYGSAVLCC
jgi:hypothetical protein